MNVPTFGIFKTRVNEEFESDRSFTVPALIGTAPASAAAFNERVCPSVPDFWSGDAVIPDGVMVTVAVDCAVMVKPSATL